MLILKEHDLERFIEADIPELEGDKAKAKHKKNLIKAKRIVADSIKDHLIPHVPSLRTPKEMFDALSRLYEGKNINQKMTFRTQLKNVKMPLDKTPTLRGGVNQCRPVFNFNLTFKTKTC